MQIQAISDYFTVLDTTTLNAQGNFRQRSIDFHVPIVWKQGTFLITGYSGPCTRLGNLYIQYQRLGYKLMQSPSNG